MPSWKCPLCRCLTIECSSISSKSDASDRGQGPVNVKKRCLWRAQHEFLHLAKKSLSAELRGTQQTDPQKQSTCGGVSGSVWESRMEKIQEGVMGALERISPRSASFLVSLSAQHHLEYILDPTKPTPKWHMMRYITVMILSSVNYCSV